MTDSTTKPQVALVGVHSDSFVQALQANNFNVEQYSSISDLKTLGTSSIAVLGLTGEDYTLSESDVDEKIRTGTVLALFGPSRALLETIHEATNTPIDIPSLELADGLPLLVYMVDGMVHIATNNVPSEATGKIHQLVGNALAGDSGDKEVPPDESFSVSLVTVDPVELAVTSIDRAVSATRSFGVRSSNLVPPPGVIGFKQGTLDNTLPITITWLPWRGDGQANVKTSDPRYIQKYDLNWYTDFYSYATGTDCRGKTPSEFTKAGGVVYTLAIDRGNLQRSSRGAPRFLGPTSGFCGYFFVDCHRTGNHPSSSMRMLSFQPRGSNEHNYSIDFQQDMQMFNNNGNSAHTFKAQYSNAFSLDRFQQHEVQDSGGVDFSVDYKGHYDHWADPGFNTSTWWDPGVFEKLGSSWMVRRDLPADNIPINGLTVFSSSVGNHTLTSRFNTEFMAFKSNSWRATDDGSTIHLRRWGFKHHSTGSGWSRRLDLTWPKARSL